MINDTQYLKSLEHETLQYLQCFIHKQIEVSIKICLQFGFNSAREQLLTNYFTTSNKLH